MKEYIDKSSLITAIKEFCRKKRHIILEDEWLEMWELIDEQPTITEAEIRAKAIDEFAREIRDWQIDIQDNERDADKFDFVFERIYEMAEQMKEVD